MTHERDSIGIKQALNTDTAREAVFQEHQNNVYSSGGLKLDSFWPETKDVFMWTSESTVQV